MIGRSCLREPVSCILLHFVNSRQTCWTTGEQWFCRHDSFSKIVSICCSLPQEKSYVNYSTLMHTRKKINWDMLLWFKIPQNNFGFYFFPPAWQNVIRCNTSRLFLLLHCPLKPRSCCDRSLKTVAIWMQLWLLGQFVSLRFKWVGEFYDYRLCCVFKASTFVILGLPLPRC